MDICLRLKIAIISSFILTRSAISYAASTTTRLVTIDEFHVEFTMNMNRRLLRLTSGKENCDSVNCSLNLPALLYLINEIFSFRYRSIWTNLIFFVLVELSYNNWFVYHGLRTAFRNYIVCWFHCLFLFHKTQTFLMKKRSISKK